MMCRTRSRAVLAMNTSRIFGCLSVSGMLSHVLDLWCLCNNLLQVDFAGFFSHSSRMCFDDLIPLPHSHRVGGFMGLWSAVVRQARVPAIVLADRLFRFAVGPQGFWSGCVLSWCRVCHASAQFWCGLALNHVNVVRLHGHGLALAPSFARVSAFLFHSISVWDEVHFPLILQPSCRKIFTSFRHALMSSFPAVGPPARTLRALWLSAHR